MYFEKIYMHGFKSFADPVTIDFNEGITCIVGPNGSGKSNISDAIRWVLGEQSPKMLRGGKMEEVIFAGTETRKSRGMAEVTLVIDNTTGILPIDYQKVAITRRMYRSGEGEYFINGNHCRLRDIRELIMDTGIGVDGYSLIGQGKISDIVSSKPESRREIFEEAAGIVKYRTKKYDAERKLDNSMQNMDRVTDIINEIEGRIGGLKTDSEKAKEYLELKNRYDKLEINITLKTIEDTDIKNEYLKDDILQLSGRLSQAREDKDELNHDLLKAKDKNFETESLISENNVKSIAARDTLANLVKDSELTREKIEGFSRQKSGIEKQTESYREKLSKEETDEKSLMERLEVYTLEKEKLDKELNDSITEYELKNQTANDAIISIDDSRNKIFELQTGISSKKSEISGIQNMKESLVARRKELEEEITSQEENLNLKEFENIKELKKNHDEEIQKLNQEIEHFESNKRLIENDIFKLEQKQRENSIVIEGAKSRKRTLEELEQSYEGYGHGVKFIMSAGISGVYGTVADVISVDKDKQLAVETALGYGLQNIVCENDSVAKSSIKILKEKRAGRLTFLPLKSMKGSPVSENVSMQSGFIGVGSDCVKFEEKYRPVIEYLLGKVAIVNDIDTAVKMSKKYRGFSRFVTLDGEVVSSSGAMTGGNLKTNKGGLLTRKAELSELTHKISEKERENKELFSRLEGRRKEFQETVLKSEKAVDERRNLEENIEQVNRDLLIIETRNKELEISYEKKKSEIEKIIHQLNESDGMIAEIEKEVVSRESEMKILLEEAENRQIENEKIKDDLREFAEVITRRRVALSKITAEYEAVNTSLRAVRDRIEEYTKEIEINEDVLCSINENEKLMSDQVRELSMKISMSELEIENICKYEEELVEERAETRDLIEKLEQKISLLENDINGFSGQKYELEIKQAKQETVLENLKNKLWEEFEISYVQAVEYKDRQIDLKEAQKEVKHLKSRLKAIGNVNLGSIEEYEDVRKRYDFLVAQRDDLENAMKSLKDIISQMDRNIKKNFSESFASIQKNFDETFSELFGGGVAKLTLEDESRPLECNIEITAQPPGKKLQNINLMSGGEKTMTAIALMFAVLKSKPTPFCVLDEVEAALDDANIERFAKYLKTFKDIQFALVTHQKVTMEHGDSLFGVTMPEHGISKVLSLKLGDEFEI